MPRRLRRPLGCVQLGPGLSLEGGQRFHWLTFAVTPGRAGALTEGFVSASRQGGQAPAEMLPAPPHRSFGMGVSRCP